MTTSELKQSICFVARDSDNDGPDFTVFGKNGNVCIEMRIEDLDEDLFHSNVCVLTPADARSLSAVLLDIAAVEEKENTREFEKVQEEKAEVSPLEPPKKELIVKDEKTRCYNCVSYGTGRKKDDDTLDIEEGMCATLGIYVRRTSICSYHTSRGAKE